MDKTESRIQAECYKWFNNTYCLKFHKPRYLMFSVPNEMLGVVLGILSSEGIPKKVINKTKWRLSSAFKATGLLSGVSDTIVCLPGKVLFIEFKTSTGTQQRSQKNFDKRVTGLGFEYYICRSLDEFKLIIAENL